MGFEDAADLEDERVAFEVRVDHGAWLDSDALAGFAVHDVEDDDAGERGAARAGVAGDVEDAARFAGGGDLPDAGPVLGGCSWSGGSLYDGVCRRRGGYGCR